MRIAGVWFVVALLGSCVSAGPIALGSFTFESTQFGNSLSESDGGTFRSASWLNTVNLDPGNPGALTGANFDTGIANIGLTGLPVYTITYTTPIVNGSGNDLGIVSARFSIDDTFTVAVSTDGVTFSSDVDFGLALAQATGEGRSYFFGGGGGAFDAFLFVTPIDLSAFGIGAGASIAAVRITASPEGDLIRVAGFGTEIVSGVPEPATWMLSLAGAGALALIRRRRLSR